MKAIPISPELVLEILHLTTDDKPLFCLRALDVDNQKVFIYYDDMAVLIKALGDALTEVDTQPPADAASVTPETTGGRGAVG